jgi:prevent-host-death family protein
MEKRMSAWQARRQFGEVLREVTRNGTSVIVESHGEAVAAVVPIQRYQKAADARAAFLATLTEMQQEFNYTPEEAEDIVEEAMRATGREYVRETPEERASINEMGRIARRIREDAEKTRLSERDTDRLVVEALRAVN